MSGFCSVIVQGSRWSVTFHETWAVYLNSEGPTKRRRVSHPPDGAVGTPEGFCLGCVHIPHSRQRGKVDLKGVI